jgi:hypothetical protein
MVDDNIDKNLLHELENSIISNKGDPESIALEENVVEYSEIDSPVSPKTINTNTDENIIFSVFPKIEDNNNNNIIAEISKEEPITEPIKLVVEEVVTGIIVNIEENVIKEDDDMSALTIESSANNPSVIVDKQEVVEPVKKKRTYKPRKKV